MKTYLSTSVQKLLRQEIKDAGGNEIFALGRTDSAQVVVDVEILARGNQSAVPAILQNCGPGDIVIHNHPSGILTPSQADLAIAGHLGSLGVGFYIIDNHVEDIYRVVEAFKPDEAAILEHSHVAQLLGGGGQISRSLKGYENRPQQLRMAFAVTDALNQHRIALIEAGTGTGKSLAYLVPSILWSKANRERLVISTNTINLQEQLIRKDLPLLKQATELDFNVALVKGRSNYLCKRRLESAFSEPGLFDDNHINEFNALRAWASETKDGSREDLSFVPQNTVWDEICCEADQCNRSRCIHFDSCFFHQARRHAARADILVANHALLLADLTLRSRTDNYSALAVLPPFSRLVIDEAHHLEDVATRYFSTRVTRFGFARLLNRLKPPRKPNRGLLPRLMGTLGRTLLDSQEVLFFEMQELIDNLLRKQKQLSEKATTHLEQVGIDLAAEIGSSISPGEEIRQRLIPGFVDTKAWQSSAGTLRGLARETREMGEDLEQLLKSLRKLPEKAIEASRSLSTDLAGISLRLQVMAQDIEAFTNNDPQSCSWFEVTRGRVGRGEGVITRLCTAPLEVAPLLRSALLERMQTLILTSATLTVAEKFDYLRERVGLNQIEENRVTELLLTSPFDFQNQALMAVPTDIPEPGQTGFIESVCQLAEEALSAAGGRSFVLFTAYSMLKSGHGILSPLLSAQGYQVLRQGEAPRHHLLKAFSQDETSILFATDSFWEGVDVPGRALEQVVIVRLPFKVPTEPVLEARAEAISRAGGDPFMEYTVPQAVIRFRQGFGRLIRQKIDRGVVLILDSRVIRRSYGRLFLKSLPDVPLATRPSEELMQELKTFFNH